MKTANGNIPAMPRDLWVPWLIVAGFALVIMVNGTLIYFAIDSFSGLQTEGHYQRGLEYNNVLAGEEAEKKLGWSVALDFVETGNNRARISVTAADKQGNPLIDAGVRVRLVRPVQAGHDIDMTLRAAGQGRYAAEFELPMRGQWDILAQINHPSGHFSTAKRIFAQ